MKGYLVLENGEVFEGERIGYNKDTCLEVVFNTSMAGYLKVFTDPSYASQGVVMTYPLIGNYGVIPEDMESKKVWVNAIFIHELAETASNFRKVKNLEEYLIENEVPGLKNVNTRKLTKILRNSGTMRGKITSSIENKDEIIKEIKNYKPTNLVRNGIDKKTLCNRRRRQKYCPFRLWLQRKYNKRTSKKKLYSTCISSRYISRYNTFM